MRQDFFTFELVQYSKLHINKITQLSDGTDSGSQAWETPIPDVLSSLPISAWCSSVKKAPGIQGPLLHSFSFLIMET
jgi:hypothetical protein